MENWIQLVKSLIRPFLILWGAVIYGVCILKGIEVPAPLSILISAIIIEYFGERAILRLKESNNE